MIKGLDTPVSRPGNTSCSDSQGQVFALWLLLGITALSVLLGCGAKEPVPPGHEPKPSASVARVVTLDKPNEYLVALKWSADVPADKWAIHRRDGDAKTNLVELALLKAQEDSFEDRSVEAGRTYTYLVSSVYDGQLAIRAQATVSIPKDHVVDGEQTAGREIKGINRLYFKSGSKLVTGADGVTIEARELHSEDGTIETFPSSTKATFPNAGRHAGMIRIVVDDADGRLLIVSRGEGGATGIAGKAGANGGPGTKGNNGDFDSNRELVRRGYFFESYVKAMKPWALNVYGKDPNAAEWSKVYAGVPWYICSVRPGNGSPGGAGTPGTDGGPGTNGGNSARILLQVKNASRLLVDVTNESGAPGAGGTGGAGGIGGPGGPPGDRDIARRCPPAQVGPQGPNGASGKDGAPGRAGFREPVCTIIGGVKSEGCRLFEGV